MALKRISPEELELGMFIHKLDGNWFDHPFWKSRFLLDDPQKLHILNSSRVSGIIIDTAKGKDVSAPAPSQRPRAKAASAPASAKAPERTPTSANARIQAIRQRTLREQAASRPVAIEQELGAAQAISAKASRILHQTFREAQLGKALNIRAVEPVVHDVLASVRRNPQAFGGLMRCKLKNELMFRHALSLSALMVSLARRMKLPQQEMHDCGLAGLLLDIGVNYLPRTTDLPNGDFRNAEPKIWQQHVMLGYRALTNDDDLPQSVLDACLQHHERLDGSGFPRGLTGDEITQVARMAAICDTFDLLLSPTTTEGALDPAAAIQRMKTMEGAFDEEILRLFIESVGLYPVGSFVLLRSQKLAMVIDEDREDFTMPIVQAFYSLADSGRIAPHRIELARCGDTDAIVGIADLSWLDLPDEAYLREMIFLSAHQMKE